MKAYNSKQRIMSQLELLPRGWYIELIPNMVDELVNVLGTHVEDFEIFECKEKYGMLRVYWHLKQDIDDMISREVSHIIIKYESMSMKICANCGAPATHKTEPWILYMCDSCDDKTV